MAFVHNGIPTIIQLFTNIQKLHWVIRYVEIEEPVRFSPFNISLKFPRLLKISTNSGFVV